MINYDNICVISSESVVFNRWRFDKSLERCDSYKCILTAAGERSRGNILSNFSAKMVSFDTPRLANCLLRDYAHRLFERSTTKSAPVKR